MPSGWAIPNRPRGAFAPGGGVSELCSEAFMAAMPPDLIGLWVVVILCADYIFGVNFKPWLGTVYVLFVSAKSTKKQP